MATKNKKQKLLHGEQQQQPYSTNNKAKSPPYGIWKPTQIQANPKLYVQHLPLELRQQTPYASAALLGLVEASPPLPLSNEVPDTDDEDSSQHDIATDSANNTSQEDIVAEIAEHCPRVLQSDDGSLLFRKLLLSVSTNDSNGTETLHLLCTVGAPPLISAIVWDRELARLTVDKAPLCYLFFPPSYRNNCKSNHNDKKLLAASFRKLLISGDPTTIDFLLAGERPMISKISWDRELALQAVCSAPQLYPYLPTSMTMHHKPLALAALVSLKADDDSDVCDIMTHVEECCRSLLSDPTAWKEIFVKAANDNVMRALLLAFSDKVVWDQDLVNVACRRCPATYSFLPAAFRDDHVDANGIMASLLQLDDDDDDDDLLETVAAAVDHAISTAPDFFADRNAVKQLFLAANSDQVVKKVVTSLSSKLPWDRELARLAADRCYITGDLDYEENVTDVELLRIYSGDVKRDCTCHIPLGMLVSDTVAAAVEVWPDFLNKCGCHLVRDDAVLREAFEFVSVILNSVDLAPKMACWLEALVVRIKTERFESRENLLTLLKCIHVSVSGEPLDCLKGDDETSVALKRQIATYLGAVGTKRADIKEYALRLVYCLLTLTEEFEDADFDPSALHAFQGDEMTGEGTYCAWCCSTLAMVNKKYSASDEDNLEDNRDDSKDENSDSEDSDDENISL